MAVTTNVVDGTGDAELDARALGEFQTVLEDVGRARRAPALYLVTTQSGSEYLVDAELPACQCPDFEYRGEERPCKHIRRVQFATGRREIPAWADESVIDPQLGMHVEDVDDGRDAADGGADGA